MKAFFSILFISLLLVSCKEQTQSIASSASTSSSLAESTGSQMGSADNFEDIEKLGKKDESCDSEEKIKESFKPKPEEKPKAFKLQGGDSGCSADGATH